MYTYICLFRGPSVKAAQCVAVSTDQALVNLVASAILANPDPSEQDNDPVADALNNGRKNALRLISAEGSAVQ